MTNKNKQHSKKNNGRVHNSRTANGVLSTQSSGTRNHSGNKKRGPFQSPQPVRVKVSKHTDYRMRGDWTEHDVHHSEREIVPHIEHFVKQHRRMPRIEEVTALFNSLQCPSYEAHASNPGNIEWDKMQEVYLKFITEVKQKKVMPDQVLNLVEDIFATFWLLGKATCVADVTMLLMLFTKATLRPSESFSGMLATLVTEHIMPNNEQADVPKMEAHSGWEPANLLHAWRQGVQNPLFEKLSFIISFLVTAGLVKERLFTLGSFEVFKAEALSTRLGCTDIVDGLLSTIIFFFEKGYACFSTCSLHPLWSATSESNEMDDDIAFLTANIGNVKNGNLYLRTGVSDNKYQDILDKAREKIKHFINSAPNTTLRAMMINKRILLDKLYTEYNNYIASSGMREAPFCFCLYGKSSVGKSSLTSILLTALLKINGFESSDDFICNVQDTDKFMSTYRTKVTGVILDDMCNTRAANAQVNPTARIIEMMNNVRVYANMAEADRKGSTFVQPKIVAITTNSNTLDAGFWSVEPVSVLRRLNVQIVVKVKSQYATSGKLDSNKVLLNYPNPEEIIKDLWDLEIRYLEPLPPSNAEQTAENWTWRTFVTEDGKKMQNVSVFEALKFLGPMTKNHFDNQRRLVSDFTNFGDKYTVCPECYSINAQCKCVKKPAPVVAEAHSMEVVEYWSIKCGQYLFATLMAIGCTFFRELSYALLPRPMEVYAVKKMATNLLISTARYYAYSPFVWWTAFIPDEVVHTKMFYRYYYWTSRWRFARFVIRRWSWLQFILLFLLMTCTEAEDTYTNKFQKYCLPLAIFNFALSCAMSHCRIVKELAARRGVVDIYRSIANDRLTVRNVVRVGAIATIGTGLFFVLRALWREAIRQFDSQPHATINPTTDEEVQERNNEANPWMQRVDPKPIKIGTCTTMTSKDLMRNIERANLVCLSYRTSLESERFSTNGVYLRSNILMMPYHVWFDRADMRKEPTPKLLFDIIRAEENVNGGWKTNDLTVHFENVIRIGTEDMVLVYIPSGGVRPDILPCFPEEDINNPVSALVSYRGRDGVLQRFNAELTPGDASYFNPYGSVIRIKGGIAHYNIPTFKGMCMATLVAEHFPPFICGFHLAGSTGNPVGSVCSVNRKTLQIALDELRTCPGYVEAHSSGDLKTKVMGKDITLVPTIDIKSPISYMEYYNADVYGSCGGGTSPTTKVVDSLIAPILTKNYNIAQQWAGPKYRPEGKKYKPWYDTLIHLVEPRNKLDPHLLEAARLDYVNGFLPSMLLPSLRSYLRILTIDEIVNGIPNVRFIDGLNMSTSMGFPFTGPKSNYIVDMYPPPNEHGQLIRKFVPSLNMEAEIAACEKEYLAGHRCHHIFKACLKDEPTKKTKDKVRVFEAAPILLQMLIRKYYLPVIRFMSMVPTISECAVGINCYGTEWAELHEHVVAFGDGNILAGDYSKWDLRLPAQLVMVAFDIMMRLAQMSGNYTQEDLMIMRGIATDVAYPVVAYNGTLLELHGSNPSGQNLTAHLNSVCNSILLRMGFIHITGIKTCFRKYVHAFTYGDDLISGVQEEVKHFNHLSYAAFLSEMDIEFTMPDKVSKASEFLHITETDFLKRKSVFNNDMMRYVGKLDIESIHKSLMNQKKTHKENLKAAMKSTIQSALHELVLHGKQEYETHVGMLTHACHEIGLVISELSWTYEERVANWHLKYTPNISDLSFLPSPIQEEIRKKQAANWVPVVGSVPDNVGVFEV
jgi:hypothetical protein